MTDLATLAIKVDASEADAGSASLDKLTAAGARTEASAGKVTAATKSASDAAAGLAAQAENLRAKFDPLYAAEKRHADTLIMADKALRANILTQQQYNQVIGKSKDQMSAHIQGLMKAKEASGAARAGMQQLSFQISDVATSFAGGINPMVIFAQQGGQVVQSIALMRGAAGGLVGFLAGPWGAAIMGGVTVLGLMIPKLFETSKAMDDVKFSSSAVGDAQSILGGVLDIATGKINNQSAALRALAQAQLAVAKVQAQARQAEARTTIQGAGKLGFLESFSHVLDGEKSVTGRAQTQDIMTSLLAGATTSKATITTLENLNKAGMISAKTFTEAASAVASFAVEGENLKVYESAERLLNGVGTGVDRKLLLKPKKEKVDKHAEELARESAAIEAQIKNLYLLADAYSTSGAAALIAEARVKAESAAIKKRGDIDLFVNREIRLETAARVADAAKATAEIRGQATAQERANSMVAAGLAPAERAAELVREQIADIPLLAAIEAARQRGLAAEAAKATKVLADQRAERERLDKARVTSNYQSAMFTGDDRLSLLREELRLVGALDAERVKSLARVKALQEAGAQRFDPTQTKHYVDMQVALAAAGQDVATAQHNYNTELSFGLDLLREMEDQAQALGSILSDAFGAAGRSLGNLLSTFTGYTTQQRSISDWRDEERRKAGANAQALARIEVLAAERSKTARMDAIGSSISAAKGLFSEHSKGYKAMEAAEKAFAAIQLINTAKSVVAGAAKMFEFLGPFAFPAVAAMIGVMASLGFKGGGSGGKSFSLRDYQAAQGTGTVLGDSSAKSDSIARSLELMTSNSDKELEYGNAMVRSLRSIENNIGNLSGLLAKQLGLAGGAFDTSGMGLGSTTSLNGLLAGGLFGIGSKIPVIGGLIGGIGKALFGTTVTKTLLDQGIVFDPETVGSILSGGIDGQTYQDIQTKKKKKMFGITTSNKTKTSTSYGVLDGGVEDQVGLLIGSMRDGIMSAASVLGIEGAGAVLDAFKVDLGKISLKDLKGSEIQEQLNAIFSKLGDDMALAATSGLTPAAADVVAAVQETATAPLNAFQAVIEKARLAGAKGPWPLSGMGALPAATQQAAAQQAAATSFLTTFQKVGEGAFETLMRLAKDYQTLDVQLASIGRTFGAVGVSSLEARENLIDLFGSLDAFVDQTQFYRENFLTQAEQMAPVMSAVSAELARLNLSGVDTIDKFKAVVSGIDLTTEAGRNLYASMMALAPGFAAVEKYEKALADQRQSMEITLLQAMGQTAAATALKRQAELDAMDASLRPLQQQIYAEQDLAAAREEAARKAAEIAQQAKEYTSKQQSLLIRVLELQGKTDEATALRRRIELDATDAGLRGLQAQVYALEDLAKAGDAAKETASKFRDFAKTIGEFKDSLFDQRLGVSYDAARAKFEKTAAMAAFGDEASLTSFTTDAQAFLDASKSNAASAVDYARDVARVAAAADNSIRGATGMASLAEKQLAELTGLNENLSSAVAAIADSGTTTTEMLENIYAAQATTLSNIEVKMAQVANELSAMNTAQAAAALQIILSTNETARILRRADRGDAVAVQVETA